MPLTVNLRHLEAHNLHLAGQLPAKELDIDTQDEMLRVKEPLEYELEAQLLEGGLLVQGRLELVLDCQCVRCLRSFRHKLGLKAWTLHLPFQGEEALQITNDCADLTPYVREDILLEFPQHPLCDPECRGLPKSLPGKARKASSTKPTGAVSSAWAELNKLKF